MNKFELNGKMVTAAEFDFNLVADMEDLGVPLQDFSKKGTSATRAYLAICLGCDLKEAGKEINEHFIANGNVDILNNALSDEMEKSDFFRALLKGTQEETTTDQVETKPTKSKTTKA